jgi:hypothetical protein
MAEKKTAQLLLKMPPTLKQLLEAEAQRQSVGASTLARALIAAGLRRLRAAARTGKSVIVA